MHVVTLSGSPSLRSRSGSLLQLALQRVAPLATRTAQVAVRTLPPDALVAADAQRSPLREALATVRQADLLLVATPIYQASYSGLLKLFLDLLPPDALRDTTVLPLATGGSPGHLLAIDYALRPLLAALGARDVLDGVFATDPQLLLDEAGRPTLDPAVSDRLDRAVAPLFARATGRASTAAAPLAVAA